MNGIPTSRPRQFGNRLYLDEKEFAARLAQMEWTANHRDTNADRAVRFARARRAFRQTSPIVYPLDGRLPAIRPAVRGRIMPRAADGLGPFDTPLDFSLYEVCGTDRLPGMVFQTLHGNGNQVVQAPGLVSFGYEMLPHPRTFFTSRRPRIAPLSRRDIGDSYARWEGEELIVETTNLTDRTAVGVSGNRVRHSAQMTVTERSVA